MSDTHPTRFTVDANGVLREVQHPGEIPDGNRDDDGFSFNLHLELAHEYECAAHETRTGAWTAQIINSLNGITHHRQAIERLEQAIADAAYHLAALSAEPDPWLDQPLTPEEQQAVDESDAMLDSGEGEEL